jgi:hypothetical protein
MVDILVRESVFINSWNMAWRTWGRMYTPSIIQTDSRAIKPRIPIRSHLYSLPYEPRPRMFLCANNCLMRSTKTNQDMRIMIGLSPRLLLSLLHHRTIRLPFTTLTDNSAVKRKRNCIFGRFVTKRYESLLSSGSRNISMSIMSLQILQILRQKKLNKFQMIPMTSLLEEQAQVNRKLEDGSINANGYSSGITTFTWYPLVSNM